MTVAPRPRDPSHRALRPGRSNLRAVLAMARDPLGSTERWFAAQGDVLRLETPFGPTWLLNHPDHLHQALVRDHASFRKDVYSRSLSDVLGEGLLTAEGDAWRRHRRLAQPAFHHQAIRGYGEAMVALAEETIAGWGPRRGIDLHAEMMRLTLRIAARTLFGARLGGELHTIGEALDVYLHAYLGVCGTGIRLPDYLPTPENVRRKRAIARLHGAVERLIRERRATADPSTLLGMLVAATEDGAGFDDRQLRDEAVTLLMAGHETTAGALTFAGYLLSQHPNVEARLHAEVDALGHPPTVADLPKLPYTARVVKETMRLYPPAWALGREALEPVTLDGGHELAPGDQLWLSTWTVQRDGRWFPDPLAFRPDRWTPAFEKALPRCAYVPFGAGPRMCIGKRFAELEAVLVLATVAQRVSLRLAPGETLELLPTVTLRPAGGLQMVVTAREGARRHVA